MRDEKPDIRSLEAANESLIRRGNGEGAKNLSPLQDPSRLSPLIVALALGGLALLAALLAGL